MIHILAFTVFSILGQGFTDDVVRPIKAATNARILDVRKTLKGSYFAEFGRENIVARLLTKATPILLLAFRASVGMETLVFK